MTEKKNGFTLIELLVVLGIIGVLSALIYASFGDARAQARNKTMMTDLKQVQLALEVYKAQYNRYPTVADFSSSGATGLVSNFIPKLPVAANSANASCSLSYTTDAGGTYYKYTAQTCYVATNAIEGIQANSEFARCPSSCGTCAGSSYATYITTAAFYQSMAVYSLGGQCN